MHTYINIVPDTHTHVPHKHIYIHVYMFISYEHPHTYIKISYPKIIIFYPSFLKTHFYITDCCLQ